MTRRLLLVGILMASAAAAGGPPAPAAPRVLSEQEAATKLAAPATADAPARALLKRVGEAYLRLGSLETRSTSPTGTSVCRAKRPNLYYAIQKAPDGQLANLAVCDGQHYYEYTEARKQYLERDATVLKGLTLSVNVRPFFTPDMGLPMLDLNGRPVVKEYAFRSLGTRDIQGRKTEGIEVSTMIRTRSGWQSFQSQRFYDAKSALLVRAINGKRVLDVENKPNVELPSDAFIWRPIPGAVKGFG